MAMTARASKVEEAGIVCSNPAPSDGSSKQWYF